MTSARNVIEVVRAHPDHAAYLQVAVGEALLQVVSVTGDQHGTRVEFARVLCTGPTGSGSKSTAPAIPAPIRPAISFRREGPAVAIPSQLPTSSPSDSQAGVFTPNATGLVREVSFTDAFIMNTFGMNVAVGGVFPHRPAPAR
jgi:hypothetical protein